MVITDLQRRIEVASDCVKAAVGSVEPVRLIEGEASYAYSDGTTGVTNYRARGDFLNDTVMAIGHEHHHHTRRDYHDHETPDFLIEKWAVIGGLSVVDKVLRLGLSGRNTELVSLPLDEQLISSGAVKVYTDSEMICAYSNALVIKGIELRRAQDAATEIVESMAKGRRAIVEKTRRLTTQEVNIMRGRREMEENEDI